MSFCNSSLLLWYHLVGSFINVPHHVLFVIDHRFHFNKSSSPVSHFHFHPIIIPHELKSKSLSSFAFAFFFIKIKTFGTCVGVEGIGFSLNFGNLFIALKPPSKSEAEEKENLFTRVDVKMPINNFYCVYGKPHEPFRST